MSSTPKVRQLRRCHDEVTRVDHPSHEWETGGRYVAETGFWWCPGWPNQPRVAPISADARRCGHTGTVGSSEFVCVREEHPSDPTKGYLGSGHIMVGRRKH